MRHRIEAYILAGGRSSRMERDKAMLELGGRTLLRRAVETLKSVHSLECNGCKPQVTIVGERTLLESAERAIPDRHPGCGPLGGMETALNDLIEGQAAEWAFFIPVDMPFLWPNLIESLLCEWASAGNEGARVCYAVVDGAPQPLVSLVHKSLHPYLADALAGGKFKVTPVLESACNDLASLDAEDIRSSDRILRQTIVSTHSFAIAGTDRVASAMEERSRHLWFANLNTEKELIEAETFLLSTGSSF